MILSSHPLLCTGLSHSTLFAHKYATASALPLTISQWQTSICQGLTLMVVAYLLSRDELSFSDISVAEASRSLSALDDTSTLNAKKHLAWIACRRQR